MNISLRYCSSFRDLDYSYRVGVCKAPGRDGKWRKLSRRGAWWWWMYSWPRRGLTSDGPLTKGVVIDWKDCSLLPTIITQAYCLRGREFRFRKSPVETVRIAGKGVYLKSDAIECFIKLNIALLLLWVFVTPTRQNSTLNYLAHTLH